MRRGHRRGSCLEGWVTWVVSWRDSCLWPDFWGTPRTHLGSSICLRGNWQHTWVQASANSSNYQRTCSAIWSSNSPESSYRSSIVRCLTGSKELLHRTQPFANWSLAYSQAAKLFRQSCLCLIPRAPRSTRSFSSSSLPWLTQLAIHCSLLSRILSCETSDGRMTRI